MNQKYQDDVGYETVLRNRINELQIAIITGRDGTIELLVLLQGIPNPIRDPIKKEIEKLSESAEAAIKEKTDDIVKNPNKYGLAPEASPQHRQQVINNIIKQYNQEHTLKAMSHIVDALHQHKLLFQTPREIKTFTGGVKCSD